MAGVRSRLSFRILVRSRGRIRGWFRVRATAEATAEATARVTLRIIWNVHGLTPVWASLLRPGLGLHRGFVK